MFEKHDLVKRYNLPRDVLFCKRCVVSNQRPRLTIDAEGVCSACRFAERKQVAINWQERKRELKELCDQYRRNDGRHDVVVPCSGGKDGSFVAHYLKHEFGMKPLTVTWSPLYYTDIGRQNLQSFINAGFDNILVTPNGQTNRKLTRAAFIEMGDPFQPFIFGQCSVPFRVAMCHDIRLVFYGEDGEVEYGGDDTFADRCSMPWDTFVKNRFSSVFPEVFEPYGITPEEMAGYTLNKAELEVLDKMNVQQHFMSYYHKWVPQENYYYSSKHSGFVANPDGRSEGTYSKYASLDDRLDGFHYYLGYIKFGIGRATSDAAHEIRDGHITREEGVALVKKYDGEFPKKHYQDFLDYCSLSDDEVHAVIDSWRSDHLWEKIDGQWRLKHHVW